MVGYEVQVRKKATGMLLSRARIEDQVCLSYFILTSYFYVTSSFNFVSLKGVSSVLLEKVTRYSVATSLVVQVKVRSSQCIALFRIIQVCKVCNTVNLSIQVTL